MWCNWTESVNQYLRGSAHNKQFLHMTLADLYLTSEILHVSPWILYHYFTLSTCEAQPYSHKKKKTGKNRSSACSPLRPTDSRRSKTSVSEVQFLNWGSNARGPLLYIPCWRCRSWRNCLRSVSPDTPTWQWRCFSTDGRPRLAWPASRDGSGMAEVQSRCLARYWSTSVNAEAAREKVCSIVRRSCAQFLLKRSISPQASIVRNLYQPPSGRLWAWS